MKKRKIAILLAAVMMLIALAACGGGDKGGASSDGPITIQYWHANADTQGGKQVEELVKKFNESQSEVIVEPVYNDNMYVGLMQNLQTSVAGGDYPAVVQIGWAYREYFQSNFAFTDPETLIAEVGTDEDKDYLTKKFPEPMLDLARDFEGDLLGLPYSVSTPVLFINKDITDAAGVDPTTIKSIDDMYAMAKEIKDKTGKYGLYIAESNDNWTIQHLVESAGGETVTKEGKANFATEGGIKAYQDWTDSINAGATLHTPTSEGNQAFVSGEVGMCLTTIAQRRNITENSTFEAYAVELAAYPGNQRRVPAGGALLAVTAQEEAEKAAALKFLKFLYEPDSVAIWTAGTGYLPPTTDATENADLKDLIENDQMFQTSYNQMDDLVAFASFPGANGLEASESLRDMRDRVFNGASPADEVPKAQEAINELISK